MNTLIVVVQGLGVLAGVVGIGISIFLGLSGGGNPIGLDVALGAGNAVGLAALISSLHNGKRIETVLRRLERLEDRFNEHLVGHP